MKIEKIELENFRSWSHSHIPLGSRLTLFIGENGSGKTAVLDAIAIGLGEILTRLPGVAGVTFRNHGEIRQVNNQLQPYTRVGLTNNHGITWDRIKRRDQSEYVTRSIGNRVGVKAIRDAVDHTILEPWGANQPFNLPVFAYYGVSRAMLDIPLRRTGFPKEFSRFDALKNSLDANTHFKAAFAWFYHKENEEHRLQKERRSFDVTLPELDAVRRAIVSMFPQLTNPRVETNPLRLAVDVNGETLDIARLSDGYQTMLGLVIDLASRMAMANPAVENPLAMPAVVCIDEVELHLHPRWQKHVVGDLLRTFPNTQFVMTTHSLVVIEAVNNHLKREQLEGQRLPIELQRIEPLPKHDCRVYFIEAGVETTILDDETGLIDNQLLKHFNAVNDIYEQLRDKEWELKQ